MTNEEIIKELSGKTVLEINELVKALEEAWGVSAAAAHAYDADGYAGIGTIFKRKTHGRSSNISTSIIFRDKARLLRIGKVDDAGNIRLQLFLHDGMQKPQLFCQLLRGAQLHGKAAQIGETDIILLGKIHFPYILQYTIILRSIQ